MLGFYQRNRSMTSASEWAAFARVISRKSPLANKVEKGVSCRIKGVASCGNHNGRAPDGGSSIGRQEAFLMSPCGPGADPFIP